MATLRELITSSLRLINVVQANETPTADDMNIARTAFNALVDGWSTEHLNIYTVKPFRFVLEPGKQNYTLGVGGDWSVERPMNIQEAKLILGAVIADAPVVAPPAPPPPANIVFGTQNFGAPYLVEGLNNIQVAAGGAAPFQVPDPSNEVFDATRVPATSSLIDTNTAHIGIGDTLHGTPSVTSTWPVVSSAFVTVDGTYFIGYRGGTTDLTFYSNGTLVIGGVTTTGHATWSVAGGYATLMVSPNGNGLIQVNGANTIAYADALGVNGHFVVGRTA